jgi:hypothetical protein
VAAIICGDVGARPHACRSARRPLDFVKKDPREGCDGGRAVGEHAAQSLRHRNHPLPHGHRRDDVIDGVRGGLRHMATVAGRTDAAALAGESHDESCAAARTLCAGESEAQHAAFEIAADLLLDVSRHGPLGGFPPLEPTLEVLGNDFVERRL